MKKIITDAVFRLDGQGSTVVFDCRSSGVARCLYWGARLAAEDGPAQLRAAGRKPVPKGVLDEPVPMTLFPEQGRGFWGQPALSGARGRTAWCNRFVIEAVGPTAQGLTVQLNDAQAQLGLQLEILFDTATDVVQRRSILTNAGDAPYEIRWCAAAAFELPGLCQELLGFHGAWINEFQTLRQAFPAGVYLRENRKGRTSHDCFPGLVAGSRGFDDHSGQVYGFHLGWSGNHRLLAETVCDGTRQVQLGTLFMPGEMVLAPGEAYTTPWAYGCYADEGLNGLSAKLHRFVRTRILPPQVKAAPRPVQFNTWEATYFDHDSQRLRALARTAASLGVERFVLDDGWFAGRDHDRRGLGDWAPDPAKYPQGLAPLIDEVQMLGMSFGLWVEPEMINPDSDLYRAHPDWVLHLDPLPRQQGRHQLVLDLTRPEVFTYLFDALDGLLSRYAISYLKWDMNRDLTTAGHDGQAAYHGQVQAFYRLLDRLGKAHPQIEIETCASGGARVDYEVLKRCHRVWPSDNNDALSRRRIQQGFTLFFPPEIMGSHVGPVTSHTTGRRHRLGLRAQTAFWGHMGIECDITALDLHAAEKLKTYISLYKAYRDVLHSGTYARLKLDDARRHGWQVTGPDRCTAILGVVQTDDPGQRAGLRLYPVGLDLHKRYSVERIDPEATGMAEQRLAAKKGEAENTILSGAFLMAGGITLSLPHPESGALLVCEAI